MFVYLLMCTDNSTYVGATVNLERRLRQHNGEIKGGAHATTSKIKQGKTWKRVCHISGFPDWTASLQFEWRWKQLSRKLENNLFPLERRMKALHQLLSLERPTTKSIKYIEWEVKPTVHIEENIEICSLYIQEDDDNSYKIVYDAVNEEN